MTVFQHLENLRKIFIEVTGETSKCLPLIDVKVMEIRAVSQNLFQKGSSIKMKIFISDTYPCWISIVVLLGSPFSSKLCGCFWDVNVVESESYQ